MKTFMIGFVAWVAAILLTALLLSVFLDNRGDGSLWQWLLATLSAGSLALFVRYGLLYLWQAAKRGGREAAC